MSNDKYVLDARDNTNQSKAEHLLTGIELDLETLLKKFGLLCIIMATNCSHYWYWFRDKYSIVGPTLESFAALDPTLAYALPLLLLLCMGIDLMLTNIMLNIRPLSHPSYSCCMSNLVMFKSQLQEYAQKSSLPAPLYETIKEGPSHEPNFRSSVIVNGVRYDSPPGFRNRKTAEHAAAQVALQELVKVANGAGYVPNPVDVKFNRIDGVGLDGCG
eukprot:Gb_24417 [translate_table: standard]